MKRVCFYCPENIFQPGGGATVASNILRNFNTNPRNSIILSKKTDIPNYISDNYSVKVINYPSNIILKVLYDLFIAPFILLPYFKWRVICLNSLVPLLYAGKTEVYFQMRMFHYEEFDTISKKIKNLLGILSIKKAKYVYVASEDHKKDLVSHLSIKSAKVKVAPLGFDFSYSLKELNDEQFKKQNYWLFISIFRPYKNIDGLIEAYGRLSLIEKELPNLYLIGDYPSNYRGIEEYKSEITNLIKKYKIQNKVKFLGIQPHDISMKYLANSNLFIFPSKFEGFGLPILEAMALEVPVISSNAHSLPEVGSDTIIYFDINKQEDLYKKLFHFFKNGYEKDLVKARERSKFFTWNSTCEVIQKSNI